MDTSKSAKNQKCVGGALVFSGRENPKWEIEKELYSELMAIWDSLKPIQSVNPTTPRLGYQGCFLRCPNDKEWIAFEGLVTLKTLKLSVYREDKYRKFEKKILSSAPKDTLPPFLFE